MKLIDKDALIAKIDSKIQKYWKKGEESDALQDGNAKYWGGVLSCLNEVKTLIDTIEVTEVNEKSTRRFPQWKPTQEQLSDLYHAVVMNSISCPSLESLYNDLKIITQK